MSLTPPCCAPSGPRLLHWETLQSRNNGHPVLLVFTLSVLVPSLTAVLLTCVFIYASAANLCP
jgi:hypothetical protein